MVLAMVASMASALAPPEQDPNLELSPWELDLGVIKEARRRQRLRRSAVGLALLVAGVLAIGIALAGGGGRTQPGRPPRSEANSSAGAITPPAAVFVKDPYMGVSCHIPSSIACDRVGLAVWLRRPAIVTATIAVEIH